MSFVIETSTLKESWRRGSSGMRRRRKEERKGTSRRGRRGGRSGSSSRLDSWSESSRIGLSRGKEDRKV